MLLSTSLVFAGVACIAILSSVDAASIRKQDTEAPIIGGVTVENFRSAFAEKLRRRRQDIDFDDILGNPESENTVMEYIIETDTRGHANRLCFSARRVGCTCDHVYRNVLVGASISCTVAQLDRVLRQSSSDVVAAEASLTARATAVQNGT